MKGKATNCDAARDEESDEFLYATIEENEIAEIENIRGEIPLFAETGNEFHPHSLYAVKYDKRFYIRKLLQEYLI